MNVFETAFLALKNLKKSAAASAAPVPDESQTEFISRTADLTPGIPHWNKGMILDRRGDKAGAIEAFRDAVRAVPQYYDAHANLTRLLCEAEKWDEAIKHGELAVRLRRNSPKIFNNLSVAYYHKQDITKAVENCVAALRLTPEDKDLRENLSEFLRSRPDLENNPVVLEAKQIWLQTAEKYYDNGFLLFKDGQTAEAIASWRTAIRLAPTWADPIANLAGVLASNPDGNLRNTKEALDLATKAMHLGDRSPKFYDALAAAYANMGRFAEAKKTIDEILPTLKAKGPLESAEKLSERLKLYVAAKPLRQEGPLFRSTPRPLRTLG